MKNTGMSHTIRRLLGALLFCCALLCCAALAEGYPESAHPYDNGLDQEWTYTHLREVEYLDVTFSEDTAFEQNYDKLYVTDENGGEISYTGTDLAGRTIRLYGSSFTMRLKTDSSKTEYGFRITQIADPDFVIENGVLTQYHGTGGVVTVPSGVTAIGDSAFRQCFDVTKVILPNTVTSISDKAFYDCSAMTSFEWSNQLKTIGEDAFRGCALKSIILPDSVTSIGSDAFSYCRQATELKLPAGLTKINSYAFHYCSSLTEIVLPDTVTSIGIYAFGQCSSLTSLQLSNQLTSIGICAFSGCSKLTTLECPDTLRSIGAEAFYQCSALADVTLSDGLASIGNNAFNKCTSLTEVVLPDNITTISKTGFDPATALCCTPGTVTETTLINAGIAYECPTLFKYEEKADGTLTITGYTGTGTDVTIPSAKDGLTVTAIGDYAFVNNRTITSVIIPEGVTTIGNDAFWQCLNLQSVSLPSTLKNIEYYAFCWCMNLSELTIPASVTEIGWSFFGTSADIAVESGSDSFAVVDGVLYTKDLKTLKYCPSDRSGVFAIPEGTEVIDGRAFFGCDQITEIRIPASVTDAGKAYFSGAFAGMNALERFVVDEANTAYQVVNGALLTGDGRELIAVPATFTGSCTVPDGVETIRCFAFYGAYDSGITEIALPDSVFYIEDRAFVDLRLLEKINLPAGLAEIDDWAFSSCGDFTATVYENTFAHRWCVNNGIAVDVLPFDAAGTILPIHPDRVARTSAIYPLGIEVEEQRSLGQIRFLCDTDATNWDQVVTTAAEPMDQLTLLYDVQLPFDTASYRFLLCDEANEESLAELEQMDTVPVNEHFCFYLPMTYAGYDEASGVLTPVSDGHTLLLQRLDEEGNIIASEKFAASFEHTGTGSRSAEIGWLDMSAALPNYLYAAEGVTSRVEDNVLIYTLPESFDCEQERVITAYPVPEGAAAWTSTILGRDFRVELYENYTCWVQNVFEPEFPFTEREGLIWFDADGNVVGCGRITVRYERASALTVQPVPAERISFRSFPFGMVAEDRTTDGQIHVVIDDEATDWNKVLTFNEASPWHNPDTGESGYFDPTEVMMQMYIAKPEGAVYTGYSPCGGISDEEIIRILTQPDMMEDTSYSMPSWGLDIASYDPETGVFLPIDIGAEDYEGPTTYAVAWADENKNVFLVEKVEVRYEHTSPEGSFPAGYVKLAAEDILPNAEQAEGVKASAEDGAVLYTVKQDEKPESIVTRFTAPANAAYYTLTEDVRYEYADQYTVADGCAEQILTLNEPESTTYVLVWLDEDGNVLGGGRVSIGWEEEAVPAVTLMPAANIHPDDLPFGMEADVTVTDGLFKVVIDDEATDWNDVFTFLEGIKWSDPETGESGVRGADDVMVGARFTVPENAVYSKTAAGCIWQTDEEILKWFEQYPELEDLSSYRHGWIFSAATVNRESGTVRLEETVSDPSWIYAIQWLDADQNVICIEKVVFEITHTNPGKTYTSTRTLIPAESIVGNAENMDGVRCEISDGLIVTIVEDKQITTTTEIIAPANAVAYSMPELDTNGERWDLNKGRVGFQRCGWSSVENELSHEYLLCWYDAGGELLGGGWITMTAVCPMPEMILPAFMKEVGEEAFAGSGVRRVILPDGCTAIASRAFADCAELSEVHIPASVVSIAPDAFDGSPNVMIYAPAESEGMRAAKDCGLKWFNVSNAR